MKAKYFYDKVCKNLDEYRSEFVTIHKTGSNDLEPNHIYFNIFKDGTIMDNKCNKHYKIEDLTEDYELYSSVQYVKCGYILMLDNNNYCEIKNKISNLHNLFYDKSYELKSENTHVLCGGSFWSYGLTESFSYYAQSSDIEVIISSIPHICSYNNKYRKMKGKKCLPFNKSVSKEKGIYVSFVVSIPKENLTEKVNLALKDLLQYFDNGKWVDLNINKNIYY